jgi:hypothetical protein
MAEEVSRRLLGESVDKPREASEGADVDGAAQPVLPPQPHTPPAKVLNPLTGRKITVAGRTYTKLLNEVALTRCTTYHIPHTT